MPDDVLSRTFFALADPTRRAILDRLRADGPASVTAIAEPFTLTQRAVSKHIAVLEGAGLVTRSHDAQRRLSHLQANALSAVDEWLSDYRALWEHRFDALDQDLTHDDIRTRKES